MCMRGGEIGVVVVGGLGISCPPTTKIMFIGALADTKNADPLFCATGGQAIGAASVSILVINYGCWTRALISWINECQNLVTTHTRVYPISHS